MPADEEKSSRTEAGIDDAEQLTLAVPPGTLEWLERKGLYEAEAFASFLEEQLRGLDTSLAGPVLAASGLGLEERTDFARRRNAQESASLIVMCAHLDDLMTQLVALDAGEEAVEVLKARAREFMGRHRNALPRLLAALIVDAASMLSRKRAGA